MPKKYHLEVQPTAPRFAPVSKVSALEAEGCLKCVKRVSCVYNVYKRHKFNPAQVVDTTPTRTASAVCAASRNAKRASSPGPGTPSSTAWVTTTGDPTLSPRCGSKPRWARSPISGAGYRGKFAGPGFDQIWTDMSEIVRPTRDGIYGREYISTLVELGRRPQRLAFDQAGELTVEMSPFVEISIPVVLDIPRKGRTGPSTRRGLWPWRRAHGRHPVRDHPGGGRGPTQESAEKPDRQDAPGPRRRQGP